MLWRLRASVEASALVQVNRQTLRLAGLLGGRSECTLTSAAGHDLAEEVARAMADGRRLVLWGVSRGLALASTHLKLPCKLVQLLVISSLLLVVTVDAE